MLRSFYDYQQDFMNQLNADIAFSSVIDLTSYPRREDKVDNNSNKISGVFFIRNMLLSTGVRKVKSEKRKIWKDMQSMLFKFGS